MKTDIENTSDLWMTNEFEDTVASALICCFETKIKKNRLACPADRLNEERLSMIKAEGPYIASNSRLFIGPDNDHRRWKFDLINDKLPLRGVNGFIPGQNHKMQKHYPGTYFAIHYIRQVSHLGKYWKKQCSGTIYELITAYANNNVIEGERAFFTVNNTGEVFPCFQSVQANRGASNFGLPNKIVTTPEYTLKDLAFTAGATLNEVADRAFCWTITAQEKTAKAHLGCMQEEIKSLLYARSLPLSATGRKRPILHLVEAHKRRIKAGIDIDITSFLRGQQTIEMNGTVFRIMPPQAIQKSLSIKSQRYLITS